MTMLQPPNYALSSSTPALLRRCRGAVAACFLAASLLATVPMAQGFKLSDLGIGKKQSKSDATGKTAEPGKKALANSKYFFDFDESAYYTSRINASGSRC